MTPLYEYRCPKCGHIEEKLVKMGRELYLGCPKCSEGYGVTMKKIVSPSSFRLKGEGWTKKGDK